MSAKTIFEQIGWNRPNPNTILQDPDLLLQIHQFDYDLSNPGFVRYFESRTGIMISKMACGWDRTLEIYSLENQPAEAHHKITKARLQDSWELFNGKG